MSADSRRIPRSGWRPAGAVLVVLLAGCGDPTPPPPPRAGDQAVVRRWLLCEECYHGEIDSVLARPGTSVPLLAAALDGPPAALRENVRRQLEETYQHLANRAAREGRVPPLTLDEYVAHFLGNYEAVYQSRAITGLAAIGTPEARAALDTAAARVRSGALIYRGDVIEELSRATGGPPPAARVGWVSITAGMNRTCGISSDRRSYCWGRNNLGQLGDSTTEARSRPTLVAGHLDFTAAAASAGGDHTCGIAGGNVYCWGGNTRGQLGHGTTENRPVPTPVVGALQFAVLTAGGDHTCAVTPMGEGYCWGENHAGQLGDDSHTDKLLPTPLRGSDSIAMIAAGVSHTCALSRSGQLLCWGDSGEGQLGDGSTHPRSVPTEVAVPLRFWSLTAGGWHTCGIVRSGHGSADGRAYCVGRNVQGQLGDSTTMTRRELREVAGGHRFLMLSAGSLHTCGIVSGTRAIWCWGDNSAGQLGDGTLERRKVPVRVGGAERFASVSAGGTHTCGVTIAGDAYCWGANVSGQLGDGTTASRPSPTRVLTP